MDPFRRVKPGDKKISAQAFNLAVDAAQDWQNKRNSQNADGSRDTPQPWVYVRNDSGANCSRFDVLGISGELISPAANLNEFKSKLAFTGVTPDADDHLGKFVILLEPIADGSIGRGVLTGAIQCKLLVPEGEEDTEFADITHGERGYLTANSNGSARIIANTGVEVGNEGSSSSEDAPVWAVVRLGDSAASVRIFFGRLLTSLPAAPDPETGQTSGTARVLVRLGSTEDRTEGDTETVVNRWSQTLPDQTSIVAAWVDFEWLIIQADCPDESESSS